MPDSNSIQTLERDRSRLLSFVKSRINDEDAVEDILQGALLSSFVLPRLLRFPAVRPLHHGHEPYINDLLFSHRFRTGLDDPQQFLTFLAHG